MIIGAERLTIEKLVSAAKGECPVRLWDSPEFAAKIDRGAEFLDEAIAAKGGIYGVTTGYGDSCTETVPSDHYYDLPVHLTRYHGCGLGEYFDPETVRAIMIVRLNTLAQGFSGVSFELLRYIAFFLEHDILPLIPQEGSVGASGDLTPLSYLAGALIGERDAIYHGRVRSSAEVLAELGKPVYRFRPKEAIAIMNGTAVMNAASAVAFSRAEYLADLSCRITAMNSLALKGNRYHFYPRLFEAKPHAGQNRAAALILAALGGQNASDAAEVFPERIQDQYSIRCAPHIIGLFYDAADMLRRFIETEMNSANDNPIIDPATRSVYHGGHFYGGHICFAMDALKNIIANLADLIDRQFALVVDKKFNRGLPPNLSGAAEVSYNHGFKAAQIAASAWTAEALKNTMPASVFSRSTECHNQDKVSMGTIAARDCLRVIELTGQTLSAGLLGAAQALHLRLRQGELAEASLAGLAETYRQVFSYFAPLEEDRPLEKDLRTTAALIEQRFFSV
ncbi:MAG: aromatic amino acid ammonia-lyase [Spirochaetaceae bacterium]|nr:aromatic amino acid ammonia-lyase [Spirochaetaceae bacterium]